MRTAALVLALALFAAPLPAQQGPGAGSSANAYRLGPGDEIEIAVAEAPQLDGTQQVAADGTVNLAYVGKVTAEGSTLTEFAAKLEKVLEADYITRATVSAELVAARSQPVTVLGAVAKPGNVGYDARWTLLAALNAAGGVAADHGDVVSVQRRATNGLSDRIEIPLDELLSGAAPELDLPLFPNDTVSVSRAQQITVYLLGEIASRGAMVFERGQRATVLTAIARAGGLSDRASPKVRIRRETEAGTREIEVNYRRLLDGEEDNPELEDGDVLIVKEAFF